MGIVSDKYHIKFFSVGNSSKGGDAILIELFDEEDNPHLILIDGGYQETGKHIVKYVKRKYPNNLKFDFIFNTHPDLDHISGIKVILEDEDIEVGSLVMNRPWKDAGFTRQSFEDGRITLNSLLNRVKEAFGMANDLETIAKERSVEIKKCFRGCSAYNGALRVLGPSKDLYEKFLLLSDKTPKSIIDENYNVPYIKKDVDEENYIQGHEIDWFDEEETSAVNQTSLIISLDLGSIKFLFTGDAGKEALNEALDYYEGLDIDNDASDFDVVQLPHHGSRKNINPELLARLDAREYIISCPPDGEKEGHPSRRLINKILEIKNNTRIYLTRKSSFVFHNGIDGLNYTHQKPQSVYQRMDGRSI